MQDFELRMLALQSLRNEAAVTVVGLMLTAEQTAPIEKLQWQILDGTAIDHELPKALLTKPAAAMGRAGSASSDWSRNMTFLCP